MELTMAKRTILALAALSPTAACSAPPQHQQVIELYQSQGCSSCPPANAVLNGLADRKDLLTLSFSVTYWDYLGWKDRFAKPAFTQRQYDYAAGAHRQGVQTPQMIINGRGFINGTTKAEVDAALGRFARTAPEPDIAATATARPWGSACLRHCGSRTHRSCAASSASSSRSAVCRSGSMQRWPSRTC